jgi:hypothetical protein
VAINHRSIERFFLNGIDDSTFMGRLRISSFRPSCRSTASKSESAPVGSEAPADAFPPGPPPRALRQTNRLRYESVKSYGPVQPRLVLDRHANVAAGDAPQNPSANCGIDMFRTVTMRLMIWLRWSRWPAPDLPGIGAVGRVGLGHLGICSQQE